MFRNINIIGFDADDTLWDNENLFHDTEREFTELLSCYGNFDMISQELFTTETQNIELYGFGIKSFTLSMLETALKLSNEQIEPKTLSKIIHLGKTQLNQPVILLSGIKEVLQALSGKYRLIVATKGDLLDQERKLKKSGLDKFFHHIEIMTDKQESNYQSLFAKLDISPSEFLMIGNSFKSDIAPVIKLGGKGVYIPYHITWEHEKCKIDSRDKNYLTLQNINQLKDYLI